MKKPWSISTTVRNPERLRDFLRVLKNIEGQYFNKDNQVKYQVLLIQNRLYKPLYVPQKFRKYYEEAETKISYKEAEEIFYSQKYEDPPMRGRQSVNPLNKLGFSIAREGFGPIIITELGNKFLEGNYDIGYIFFKSLLKLQFPNPWSEDFSEKEGFNIMPFVSVIHLIDKLNRRSTKGGLNKTEFSIFVPTLINFEQVDEYVEKILEYREKKNKKDKDRYILNFAKKFYETKKMPDKKINNLFDYGDNIMRYFRLTRYFKVSMDPLGYYWNIDIEPSRKVEIEQLLEMYNGEAFKFKSLADYLSHLSDITKPTLPWEKKKNLEKIAKSLTDMIMGMIKKENLQITQNERKVLLTDVQILNKNQLENHISCLRAFNLELKERLRKIKLLGDVNRIKEIIVTLRDSKKLKKYEPEQFEKLITETLKIINDEIAIKPNYPVDDDGEPVSHSPGNKPDIECYYTTFQAICEVTLNTSKLQWVQEGQPIMRHLRDFEVQHQSNDIFCIFITPQIHTDTYSQFWIAVKYEYNGLPQKIVPMTTEQFAVLLETLLNLVKQDKRFSHKDLYKLYSMIINETKNLSSFSNWANFINEGIIRWQNEVIKLYES